VSEEKEQIVTKPVTLALPVKLTDEELACLGKEVGELAQKKGFAEGELADTKKEFKKQIDSLTGQMDEIYKKLRDQAIIQDVECEATFDYDEKTVVTVRNDTGEEVDRREMHSHEKQPDLPMDEEDEASGDEPGETDPDARVIDGTCDKPEDTDKSTTDTTTDNTDDFDNIGD